MPLMHGRKRRAPEAEEDVESPEASPEPQTQRRRTQHGSDDEDFDGENAATTQNESLHEMSKKLVRLALACEFQRKPIRRGDISEKVLGANSRQFKQVWAKAQLDLETVFGMRMVEMPAREKLTTQQKRAAQKSASQPKSASTISWQLISVLPSDFRNPQIIQPSAAPTAADESAYTAIYTTIVSFIRLSGGTLPDVKMNSAFKKLGMEDRTPITGYEDPDKLQKRLEKDGYVIKVRESNGTGEDDVYWVLGPRAKVEVGDQGVRALVHTIYTEMKHPDGEEELERKLQRSLGVTEQPQADGTEQPPREKPKKKASRQRRNDQASNDEEAEDRNDQDGRDDEDEEEE